MTNDIRELGFLDVPPPASARSIQPLLSAASAGALPDQYIVPAFRHWFDDQFRPIPENVNTLKDGAVMNRDQGQIDACVGFAFALQKSSHEGMPISPKDVWALTKELDSQRGYTKSGYGATAWSGADAIAAGVASEAIVPSSVAGKTREQYMEVSTASEVVADREKHKGKTPYFVGRDLIKRTLIDTGHPVATSCQWFEADNEIGRNGSAPFMTMPTGENRGGHMFGIIGWLRYGGVEGYVVPNSWSKAWGWNGMFLIPTENGVTGRLGNGYVHVDKDDNIAELLHRFDQKNVRLVGTPDLYRCELGVMRKWPNEIVWWSHGNLFGFDTFDITPDELAAIPAGPEMKIEDAPAKTRELVRQIRQSVGLQ